MGKAERCRQCGDWFTGDRCPRCDGKPMSRKERQLYSDDQHLNHQFAREA